MWERANRELIAKLLTELEYEDVLEPEPLGDGRFRLSLGPMEITYAAVERALGHWRVDPDSIEGAPDDVAMLVALGAPALGADATTTAGLVAEVTATAISDAHQLAAGPPSAELLDAGPVAVERALRGHPWIVASKGRIGFDAEDVRRYAPEGDGPVALQWIAVDPALADVAGLPNEEVARESLGEDFERLGGEGVLLPVHPWQWRERIVSLYAGELARGEIVPLGAAGEWWPTQSIRTVVSGERRQLKLALSILNTSVYRGVPRARALAAPALTAWLGERCAADPFLRETGLELLGEVASASVPHRAFEAIGGVPYQHTEMLGAIWREPVRVAEGERALPLAALLHADPDGVSLSELLIARSGLAVGEWVRRLHEVTLPPLLHVLYRFGATFSPHGQNCLVVLRDDVPVRLIVKDFVDDMQISADPLPELADMPAVVQRALGDGLEAPILCQWIQAGLLVCVHRYLSELLLERMGYAEASFWTEGEQAVARYQERFEDELGDRFTLFDFEAPTFVKLCLNRVRLLERGYADAAVRPIAAARGFVPNPLAPA
jgi:siderophore synthetase component